MAKPRRKKRTQASSNDGPGKQQHGNRRPKSMVIRMGAGDVGSSVTSLARDFRAMMEPDTASRLKERRANKLKDYTTMAGPLGVTHLFLFSRSKSGNVHLRVALTPRGPTLTFRVDHYALCKDIAKAQKRPRSGGNEYTTAPLLVMNNFASQSTTEDANADPIKKQLESLTTTIFQSIFPPISPQTTPLNSIRRIMLLNREAQADGTYIISLRHYAITTRRTGVSKRVRRFDPSEQRLREKKSGALPNLGKLEDVADYLLDPSAGGYTSASETELDTDAEVEVLETTTQRVLSRRDQQRQQKEKQKQAEEKSNGDTEKDAPQKPFAAPPLDSHIEKRAVKLVELGPRMRLRLVKVEEGICEGRVMWNEFVTKSKEEEKQLDEKWEVRKKEKEARRKEQRENVERKKLAKKNAKANSGKGEEDEEDEEWDSEDLEDWDEDMLDKDEDGEVAGEEDGDGDEDEDEMEE